MDKPEPGTHGTIQMYDTECGLHLEDQCFAYPVKSQDMLAHAYSVEVASRRIAPSSQALAIIVSLNLFQL